MVILGRTTFGVYLVHYTWIIAWFADVRQGMWLSNLTAWWLVILATVIPFLYAVPFSMCSEVPFTNPEKNFQMPKFSQKDLIEKIQKILAKDPRSNYLKQNTNSKIRNSCDTKTVKASIELCKNIQSTTPIFSNIFHP